MFPNFFTSLHNHMHLLKSAVNNSANQRATMHADDENQSEVRTAHIIP